MIIKPFVKSHAKARSLSRSLFIVAALFLLYSVARNISRITNADQSLDDARRELARLEDQQTTLQKELEKVTSQEFVEKEARDKLNLAKEGEIVLVLPEDGVLKSLSPRRVKAEEAYTLPDPNWKKWMQLFF